MAPVLHVGLFSRFTFSGDDMMASTFTKAVDGIFAKLTTECMWVDAAWAAEQLENYNITNRPMTMSIVKRYMYWMLEGRWVPSSDTIGYDTDGNLVSGQHRLMALVLAEKMRVEDPDYVKNVYGIDKPIKVPFVVMRGLNPNWADYTDIGKTRTGADVLARRHLFGEGCSDAENKRMHKELAVAARLVWTRMNGKTVRGSGVFQHHELKAFVDDNVELVDCVKQIRDLDMGDANDRLIRNYLTIGYASGLLHLMMSSDPEKAEEFWTLFAAGALPNEHPISRYKSYLLDQRNEGTVDRDHVINAAVKAWNAFSSGKMSVTKAQIKPKKDERPLIVDSVDAEPVVEEEPVVEVPIKKKADKKPADKKPAKKTGMLSDPLPREVDHMAPKFG